MTAISGIDSLGQRAGADYTVDCCLGRGLLVLTVLAKGANHDLVHHEVTCSVMPGGICTRVRLAPSAWCMSIFRISQVGGSTHGHWAVGPGFASNKRVDIHRQTCPPR